MKKSLFNQKGIRLFILLAFISLPGFSQVKEVKYKAGLSASFSEGNNLPFWLVTNKNGIIPDHNNGVMDFSVYSDFSEKKNKVFDFAWGASFVGSVADESNVLIQQAYGSLRWKWLQLDLGAKDRPIRFDGLSVTNGDLLYSGNARSIPEINFQTNGFVPLGFTNNWVSFRACFSNGIMLDDRFVDNTNVHHKNLFIRIGKEKGFSVVAGVDHYAQWDGDSPIYGDLGSFRDFFRVVTNQAGHVLTRIDNGETSINESYNKIGNHLGQNSLELNYNDDRISTTLYVKNIFEDKSGDIMHLPPVRDWNAGLFLNIKKGKLVRSVMYEFFYTKDQGGYSIRPNHPIEPVIGFDSYFNNSVYRSGWTHHGRTIGLPLLTPNLNTKDGLTYGVKNNAIQAHHFGITGEVVGLGYRFLATFSDNFGKPYLKNDGQGNQEENYSKKYSYEPSLKQQSYLFEMKIPQIKIPFEISASIAYDKGELLGDNLGFSVRVVKKGIFGK